MTCVNKITNAAPLVIFRNTRDASRRVVPIESTPPDRDWETI